MNKKFISYIESKHPVEELLYQIMDQEEEIIIFDAGGCEGEDSIRYSKMFPDAKIYTFEPLINNFQILEKNIREFKCSNIFSFNVALSDTTGTAILNISSGNPEENNEKWNYGNKSSSLLTPHHVTREHSWLKFNESTKVQTETIKNIISAQQIEKISLLHMDVQGAEMKVLKGAGKSLEKINAIWLEVGEIEYYQDQPLKKDIEAFLISHGFHLITTIRQGKAGDQLYLKASAHDRKAVTARKSPVKLSGIYRKIIETWKKRGHVSYSQSGEDMIIRHLCSMLRLEKPSYIDVGAHDPFHLNNTASFYENGSRGINIEPDPLQFELFRKHRSQDINLNIAIGNENKDCTLHIFKSRTLNTLDGKEAERMVNEEDEKKIAAHEVAMLDLYRCLLLFNKGEFPDMLMIDTEGLDKIILEQLDRKKGLPKIICAETIDYSKSRKVEKNKELIELIKNKGFSVYADTFINTIFYRSDLL